MSKIFDEKLLETAAIDTSLREFSHLGIGGKAKNLFAPHKIEEISKIVSATAKANLNIFPVGAASNILFGNTRDKVIILDKFIPKFCEVNGNEVLVSANYKIAKFIDEMKELTLGGLEFLAGVPANIGGAVSMNAGAFGGNISDFIEFIEVVDHDGKIREYQKEEIDFGYRKSSINGFITKVGFILAPKPKEEIMAEAAKIIAFRKVQHPYNFPSLGSTFKNPENHAAGKLIEECGLKGKTIGGAQISKKHANFIVNKGNATYRDVKSLIDLMMSEVYRTMNIMLQLEIKVLD
ncbi:MAG: UDP-N-acetylmuramate dehydrogenase [Candidatus Cloacimonetes bacterium]|jgi:UDP-N-acetylmuramate dehydrogenase|nr:UDP-N-acetylmuramate dehydrogenase [Candidatus Cloacimonadota bacterium]MBT6993973.1 UDP-N-acetylmuramate dehydrogenase [Candidatus Cloacimonadota bacterium]MBT7469925.1 UDP-N-acetylmuramate dehydrogenase [Candidatus Cloacimonadota bacterium]